MNKFLLFFLLAAISLPAIAQKPTIINDSRAKLRTISGSFTKIVVSSGIELYLTQSNETALAISVSDDKYESRVKTVVKNGVLTFSYDNNGVTWTNDRNRKIKAYLSCKDLEGISGSAGALIKVENEFNSSSMSISISSGARFEGKMQTKILNAGVSSGGGIEISGVAVASTLEASSGAALNAFKLTTKECIAKASSGASIKIAVEKTITASASSGGQIMYKGNADLIKQNTSRGGSIKQTS